MGLNTVTPLERMHDVAWVFTPLDRDRSEYLEVFIGTGFDMFSLPWIGTSLNTRLSIENIYHCLFSLPWIGTSLNTLSVLWLRGKSLVFSLPWIGIGLNTATLALKACKVRVFTPLDRDRSEY